MGRNSVREARDAIMLIQELSRPQCLEVLASTHFGRLACAREMQPYIVPIHFAYRDYWLYSFSVQGQKIDWMRANPSVCVEVDQLRRERWTTVIVFGRYEELFDTPQLRSERALALHLLQQRAMWWEPASASGMVGVIPAPSPVFFRIKVEQVTGRCGTSEPVQEPGQANPKLGTEGWLRETLRRRRET